MDRPEAPASSEPTTTTPRPPWGGAAVVGLTLAVLQTWVVLTPDAVELDQEELYNAAHAWELLQGHFSELFVLQYRRFCGGCTLDALLGAALFSILPPSFFTWKLVPMGFTVVLGVVGFLKLHRHLGATVAWAFAALLALPPQVWVIQSLVAWGNHYEAGALAALGLLCLPPPSDRPHRAACLGSGALLALALWTSFSATFAVVGIFIALALQRRTTELQWWCGGLALVLVPWALQGLTTGTLPFGTIYEAGYATPDPTRIPSKIATLLAPQQLAAMFGLRHAWLGLCLATGWLVGLGTALYGLRRSPLLARQATGLAGLWGVIYLVVAFQVHVPDWPLVADAGALRYVAPLYPVLF
ncbi:MAG: hypothetical protein QGG40_18130, partial [Myxococcota bacterium]|nr:hypothetical protein [Myxococcota bacterium]